MKIGILKDYVFEEFKKGHLRYDFKLELNDKEIRRSQVRKNLLNKKSKYAHLSGNDAIEAILNE
ncbi:hypothetical protein AHEVV1_015 [Adoxophyes honmai entomopoxvirus 'L' virophage 1]|nr:hypothetical protein AHEVV1_015 [Adoxophyes honmai entomopoxvirus 'L' virophage 1]